MKILPVSDLHFEFHRDNGASFISSIKSDDVDVLVIAGDLCSAKTLDNALDIVCSNFKKVVYVTGNHEFYNSTFDRVQNIILDSCKKNNNLYYLNNNKVVIDNITFAGTTLWFGEPSKPHLKNYMNDFRLIYNFKNWVYKENDKAKNFLRQEINSGDIVVTHYLPSKKCIHKRYKDDPLNCFFLCDVEDIMLEKKSSHWIFGHSHASTNKIIGSCKAISNPFGYAGVEENVEFNPKLIIEI